MGSRVVVLEDLIPPHEHEEHDELQIKGRGESYPDPQQEFPVVIGVWALIVGD